MAKYFCRIEYLESSGTQHIDTGMTFNSNTDTIELGYQNTATAQHKWMFGSYETNANIGISSGTLTAPTFWYKGSVSSTGSAQYNSEHILRYDSTGMSNDGTNLKAFTSYTGTWNLYLFALNNTGTSPNGYFGYGKIFYYKQTRNGVTIRDLIPVLDNNGRPAMYDNVSGQLFYNQGTGEFNVGRQIHPVEYLESTGGQYIDTGIQPTDEYGYRIRNTYAVGAGEQCAIGCMDAGNRFVGIYTGGSQVSGGWGSFVGYLKSPYSFTDDTIWDVSCNYKNDRKIILNNEELKDLTDTNISGTISNTIYLFARHYGSNITKMIGKIYGAEITNGQTVVADYIPCIDENLVPFMFDLVNCKIYENAGTGQFKVGKYLEQFGANKKLLRKKYDIMLSSCFKKKPYYCELEYLESSGTEYINTGLLSTANSKVDCVFGFSSMESGATNNCAVFGGRNNTTSTTFTFFKLASGNPQYFRFDYNNQKSIGTANDLTWNTASKYRFEYDGSRGTTTNITTGESAYESISPASTFTTSPILLFAVGTNTQAGQFMKGRIYKYWYTDGTNTIDLIPVLDWNMTPCMYDKVTRKLFYNQGTGNFSYGREIHPVEYIEAENGGGSTVVEYAVGNYRLTNTTNWEITFSASNSNNSWVMGQPTWIGVHYRKDTTTSNLPRVGITNGAASANQCYVDYTDNEKITLALKGTDVYANGVKAGSITRASAGATQTKYGIFAYKDIGQELPNLRIQSARIYRLKIWDNGVLVQDLIPAIDEKGIGGFFENVSRTFIDKESNCTSEFGYPPVQLEYLESTGNEYIDTGIKFDCANTKIEVKTYEDDLSRVHSICGDDGNCFYYFRGTGNWAVGYNYTASNVSSYIVVGDNVFVLDKNKVYLNGTLATTYTASSAVSSYNALLFNRKTNLVDKGAVTMYYCKIWNGSTIIRDFIPVLKDGQAGMLDKQNNVFYPNVGTGSFVAGKILESKWF